jgi:hypothetical protein
LKRVLTTLALLCAATVAGAQAGSSKLTHEQAKAFVDSLLVASPYKLGETVRSGRIRYRLVLAGMHAPALPETGEQHVDNHGGAIEIDICADCGEEAAPSGADLARYRSAGPWVESNDRAVRAFARRGARGGSVHQQMEQLRVAVRAHMDGPIDFRRYDSAATALRIRSGDCTEVALLLAAAARARGIPARIAFGIAYSSRFTGKSHVFSPHAWVQAWDGQRWRSYDAGLGRFDSGHIALAIGDGTMQELLPAMSLIPRLRIEDAYAIAPAGSASANR